MQHGRGFDAMQQTFPALQKKGNLEATPLVDNGMMYVPDGWGSVYAIDVSSGKKAEIK